VDTAIVSNASGLEPLIPALINGMKSLAFHPVYFFRQPSFLFIWGVYSGTFIVANSIEATCERSNQSSFYPKFFGSSVANITLSILKDKAFAKMFADPSKPTPKPMVITSYACFASRDSMSIMASFSLPGLIAAHMRNKFEISNGTSDTIAQLMTPVTMQIFNTPLHLLGLDLYNRKDVQMSTRRQFIVREYFKTMLARMARIFPAYGIGGVLNKNIRKKGVHLLQIESH